MKKIISIALSLILLSTSVGLAKSTHFCGGFEMLSELSLNASHIDCGMEKKAPECESNDGSNHVKAKGCCDNEFELLQMDEDFSISKASFNLDLNFTIAFAYTFIFNSGFSNSFDSETPYYSPPILQQDTQILFQRFLI